ncbi:MAG: ribonuclease HII [Candidatus Diapherotrites archaeon]|uniref:Ribonuclease HII n=1 Tax=Candidatus Iainarchaeum sp. TaxID=3101447 RepID=A0A8T4L801_9ARCH|nr:ribonuclease HII [Candidatus Diapherotrites archaeon]
MLIAGIDEAGRGPAIGPMVLAVASIEKGDEERLVEMGVTDSKLLSPAKREAFYPQIKALCRETLSTQIAAQEIDELRERQSLNEIEAMRIGWLLNNLHVKPDVVYVDAPDVIQENFGKRIERYCDFSVKIVSEHKADLNYPICGAASVIAKVERDEEIKKLAKTYGEMGSGYPHDEVTIRFIKNWLQQNNKLPDFVRKSWDTNQRLLNERFQKKLHSWKG